jgi:DNA-binding beta-propeller fold protein YncE
MRPWIRRTVTLGLAAAAAFAAAPWSRADDKTDAEIARWIAQLGDEDAAKRAEAAKQLEAIGEPALGALRKASESDPDVDVRLRAGLLVRKIEGPMWEEVRTITGPTAGYWLNRVAFSPDGKTAIATGGGVIWFDLQNGKEVNRVLELQFARPAICLSKDGTVFLTGHQKDKDVRLGDVKTGKVLKTFQGHTAGVYGAALSPDGALAVTGGDDKTLRIWDVKEAKELRQCEGVPAAVRSVAFAPKGDRLASGHTDGSVKLWDATTGKEAGAFKGHTKSVNAVTFLPDGATLLTASADGTVRLWEVETGKEKLQMKHDGGVNDAAVAPDGKRALTAGFDDKTVRLWDLSDGKEVHRFTGHGGHALGVAFSPDGKQALTSDAACTVRLWQLGK